MSKLLDSLHQLLPASRSIGSDFYLTVDAVIDALNGEGYKLSLNRVSDFDSRDWDDEMLEELIFSEHRGFHKGTVFIHTPACSRFGLEDFACRANNLKQFISEYNLEMLFDGDVIFLAPESKTLTLFHHEGAFGHIQLNN